MTLATLIESGSPDNRVDIVFLGDGYQSTEFATYETHVDALLDYLFAPVNGGTNPLTDPFGRYKNYFNVHLVYTASDESGADDPNGGTFVDTDFDATYNTRGIDRLLTIDNSKGRAATSAALSGTDIDAEMRFVVVNSEKYGGGGGFYAVYAGGNKNALEVAVHEIAHSFVDLADEYGGNGPYLGSIEPREVNVTLDPTGAKWSHWLGYDQPGIGTIGAYDGGRYYDSGVYRPSHDSKMRSLGNNFDVVSQEAFVLGFYDLVDPLDAWSHDTAALVTGADILSVDPVDPNVVDVAWFIDGAPLGTGDVHTVDLTAYRLAPGDVHTVRVLATDPTDMVRRDLDKLQQELSWQVEIPHYVQETFGTADGERIGGVLWDDRIEAGEGADVVRGRTGDDRLFGGNGWDFLFGSWGHDQLYGQAGFDWLSGGIGDDILRGRNGRDVLLGGAGDDTILGGRHDDSIEGGPGDDWINAGEGDDTVLGEAGSDTVAGGAGDDTVDGGEGRDDLFGGSGNDGLIGGAGQDTMGGGLGDDLLSGGRHIDWLYGGNGADTLEGGGGDDWLSGDLGRDTLTGGPGADVFVYDSPTQGRDRLTDFASGEDIVLLDRAGFTALAAGFGPDNLGFGPEAADADEFLVFDGATLWYDPDAIGGAAAVALFDLAGGLNWSDIIIGPLAV